MWVWFQYQFLCTSGFPISTQTQQSWVLRAQTPQLKWWPSYISLKMHLWVRHHNTDLTHNIVNQIPQPRIQSMTLWTRHYNPDFNNDLVNQTSQRGIEPMNLWTRHCNPYLNPRPCEPDIATQIWTHKLMNQTLQPKFQPTTLCPSGPCEMAFMISSYLSPMGRRW